MNRKTEKMLHVYIGESLKEELREEAKQFGLSLNAYIRMLLTQRKK